MPRCLRHFRAFWCIFRALSGPPGICPVRQMVSPPLHTHRPTGLIVVSVRPCAQADYAEKLRSGTLGDAFAYSWVSFVVLSGHIEDHTADSI